MFSKPRIGRLPLVLVVNLLDDVHEGGLSHLRREPLNILEHEVGVGEAVDGFKQQVDAGDLVP